MKKLLLLSLIFSVLACGDNNGTKAENGDRETGNDTLQETVSITIPDEEITTTNYEYELVVPDLQIAWGMDFLPDGSILITEKSGDLIHFKNGQKHMVEGAPEVYNRGQGGFHDVALSPDYGNTGWIYFTYASTKEKVKAETPQLMRAKLENNQLTNKEVLYKAMPNSTRGQHFGSRIDFDNQGHLYFSIGDRGNRDVNPQDLTRDGGKVYRLNLDGSIPAGQSFCRGERS